MSKAEKILKKHIDSDELSSQDGRGIVGWVDLAKRNPPKKGQYVIRSKETRAKHVLPFSGEYFYKVGNGFQATQFEWLDESPITLPVQDEWIKKAKNIAVDFFWENVFDKGEGFQNLRVLFDEWYKNKKYYNPLPPTGPLTTFG